MSASNYDTTVKSTGTVTSKRQSPDHLSALLDQSGQEMMVYHDPEGYVSGRPVDKRADMAEAGWDDAFEQFDEEVREGAELREAAKEVKKSFDTADVSLPVFVRDEFFVSDSKQTPIRDLMARVAVDETTVKVDELSDIGGAGTFAEGGTIPENDDTTAGHTYDIYNVGRKNEVSDLVQLTRASLNPQETTVENQAKSINRYEENQIIKGNDGTSGSSNDTSGWQGLSDLVPSGQVDDLSGASDNTISLPRVRNKIRTARENGADYDDLLSVTDFKTYQDLKGEFQDFLRVESEEELSFGYRYVDVDGVPVVESHGAPNSADSREFWVVDMSAHFMAVLADKTLKPLPVTDTGERVATYCHETYVSMAPDRIAGYVGLA